MLGASTLQELPYLDREQQKQVVWCLRAFLCFLQLFAYPEQSNQILSVVHYAHSRLEDQDVLA